MIKTLAISFGLVGMTAFGGMALSMAHDLSFASPERVAPQQVLQVALAMPAPQSGEGQAAALSGSTTLRATEGSAQIVPAILESSGPHNRLAGKSMATASRNAPIASISPLARVSEDQRSTPRDVDATISAPVFSQREPLGYTPSAPVSSVPRPVAVAVSAPARQAAPEPDFLIGVFR